MTFNARLQIALQGQDGTEVELTAAGVTKSVNLTDKRAWVEYTAAELISQGDDIEIEYVVKQGGVAVNAPQSVFVKRVKPSGAAQPTGAPSLISPAPGSVVPGANFTIVIDPGDNPTTRDFKIDLGASPQPNVNALYNREFGTVKFQGTDRGDVTGMPTNGDTIYGQIRWSDNNFEDFETTISDGRAVRFELTQATQVVVTPPSDGTDWAVDEISALPGNKNWTIIDAHDSGYMVDGWTSGKVRSQPHLRQRIILNDSPDSHPAFQHFIDSSDSKQRIVDPLGLDSDYIQVDFSQYDDVLLRYHHYMDSALPYYGFPGKYIAFQCGQGMIGSAGFAHQNNISEHGNAGMGANTMHPTSGSGGDNGLRLLAGFGGMTKQYGHSIGSSSPKYVPTGRWNEITIRATKNVGWRLYVNGQIWNDADATVYHANKSASYRHPVTPPSQAFRDSTAAAKFGPVGGWNDMKTMWYRIRLMNGGTPDDYPATKDTREWFGGFFMAAC